MLPVVIYIALVADKLSITLFIASERTKIILKTYQSYIFINMHHSVMLTIDTALILSESLINCIGYK